MNNSGVIRRSFDNVVPSGHRFTELALSEAALTATTERCGHAVIVTACGELDASNESAWRSLLADASAATGSLGLLVIDISGVDFVACCAYAALGQKLEHCRRRGIQMRLVSNQIHVGRMVAAFGLDALLPLEETVDAALAGRPQIAVS